MSDIAYIIEAEDPVLEAIAEIVKEDKEQNELEVSEPFPTTGEGQLNDPFTGAVILVTHAITVVAKVLPGITAALPWITASNALLSILDRLKKRQKPSEQPIVITVRNFNAISNAVVINVSESTTEQVKEQLQQIKASES